MKHAIEYFYNLDFEELLYEDDAYHFVINNEHYYFVHYFRSEKDLNDIIECSKELKSKKVLCHDILFNIKGEALTKIDDVNYILMKVYDKDKKYNITHIMELNKKLTISEEKKNKYVNNWAYLWSSKIDYIENQLSEINVNNIIKNSIDYYIGLSENAISYVNNISLKYSISNNDRVTLSHRRIYYPNYGLNYLNPLSFLFDLEVRDISEYIKHCFFYNDEENDASEELSTYLKSNKLTIYSYNMLFARLLFPSYYFDIYEKIVNKNLDSEKLIKIINKVEDYEQFLKKAYKEISSYAPLEKIKWLIY